MRRLVLALALVLGVAACGSSVARVSVPAMLPPAASTWPKPPVFPESSCWTRDTGSGAQAYAPQYLSRPRGSSDAKAILKRLLRSFGDRSVIISASLGPPPPETRMHSGYFPKTKPPADAAWLYLRAPATIVGPGKASPNEQLAEWEVSLFAGGLRDALCLAGSRPLVGWTRPDTAQPASPTTTSRSASASRTRRRRPSGGEWRRLREPTDFGSCPFASSTRSSLRRSSSSRRKTGRRSPVTPRRSTSCSTRDAGRR